MYFSSTLDLLCALYYGECMILKNYFIFKLFALILLFSYIFVGVLGFSHLGMSMKMDEHGNMVMSDCAIPGMDALCSMGIFEHIAVWQHTFSAIAVESITNFFFVLFSFVFFGWIYILRDHIHVQFSVASSRYAYHANLPMRNISLLFSDGILHSKQY